MPDIADGAIADHARRLLQGRHVAIGQVHHVHHPGAGGGIGHLLRIGGIGRQGLFAQDMLARRQHLHGGRVVHRVWGDIGHRVEFPQASAASIEAKRLGMAFSVQKASSCSAKTSTPATRPTPGMRAKWLA